MSDRPKVIVLCGSSKFVEIMAVVAWLLERNEKVITMGLHLLPLWCPSKLIPDHLTEHEGVAKEVDELHRRKIDLADGIFVVNYNGYIGKSTKSWILYAMKQNKPVRWYSKDPIGASVKRILSSSIPNQWRTL